MKIARSYHVGGTVQVTANILQDTEKPVGAVFKED